MKLNYKDNDSSEENYINEIIRITYKCNWSCKFCNVLMTNNYWTQDISHKEIIYKILSLVKKYNTEQRKNLTLSFSWGEPTLNKKLSYYIWLAKKIWVWNIQIQTNWTNMFLDNNLTQKLYDSWLNEIFLAQHWSSDDLNKKMWIFFNSKKFEEWVSYIYNSGFHKKILISFNIVINKINIYQIYEYIKYLKNIWFFDILESEENNGFFDTKKVSFWLVQPNWYANINKEEVLLTYNKQELEEIYKIINLCKIEKIYPDFHFTAPPLCILNIPEYNLEHQRMKKLNDDIINNNLNKSNLDSYKYLWKEKTKINLCKKCKYNDTCLWFYKNWLSFVWEKYAENKVLLFISK